MSEPFIGEIQMFGGNFAPRGWAFCDGQLLDISQNDALFSLLGTIYGGDGRTTFGLPELRGRVPIHMGTGPGLSPRQIGSKSGTERVTLTASQLPSHSHPLKATSGSATTRNPAGKAFARAQFDAYTDSADLQALSEKSVSNVGGSQSHNNMMPFQGIQFIIALFGFYPSRQ